MPHLTLKATPHKPSARRVVLVVPKMVVKKATQRNLIKRRIRAILEPLLHDDAARDFVVIARRGIEGLVFSELKNELLAEADRYYKK